MAARLNLEKGPVFIRANDGRYNLDTQKLMIDGPVKVAGADGYRLATRDVGVDLKARSACQRRSRRGFDAPWTVPGGPACTPTSATGLSFSIMVLA